MGRCAIFGNGVNRSSNESSTFCNKPCAMSTA